MPRKKKTTDGSTPSDPTSPKMARATSAAHRKPATEAIPAAHDARAVTEAPRRYQCGPVHFSGDENASYERHLVFDHVIDCGEASDRERFEALARSLRDLLTPRWLKTQQTYDRENPKRVYYLSMEFLIGRSLTNNITNLLVEPLVQDMLKHEGLDLTRLAETEPDAGLGNGGLGRLAACFIDSLATLADPGHRLRPALRVRHLPAGDQGRLPGREPRQLAAPARPLGSRPAGRGCRGPHQLRLAIRGRRARLASRPSSDSARHALRPAGRRLWRQDHQHAAALGGRHAGLLRLRRVQPRAISSGRSTTRSWPRT